MLSYVLVLSGIVYDIIVEPPSMGQEYDSVTGRPRPVAILKYRINGQYILEGLSAGLFFFIGGGGFLLVNYALTSLGRRSSPVVTALAAVGGLAGILIGVLLSWSFLVQKVSGY
eukprot:EC684758.1.p2 GENE.EC684758.1~~EC684758.1.p2  ORF type:complete len:114 (+),score=28.49 EC684758.1:140-481(+)